ncbi:MAG TPA: choice-of-anchor D domain-containing protein [Blastocatellia bacterium]|nr:choice-of-anchor D domain-containing protein [Blastocatellia bacterium]
MKLSLDSKSQSASRRIALTFLASAILVLLACAAGWFTSRDAAADSSARAGESRQDAAQRPAPVPNAGDTCAAATVINPAALPFLEDSTTAGAANNIDPGPGGCGVGPGSIGAGPDVVYSFTPTATDTYTIGATPFAPGFDISLYVVTNCANPSGTCVAASTPRDFGLGEFATPVLTAGTQYFIVVDSPNASGSGAFHFSLRRALVSNDTCDTPVVIEPSRLPFISRTTTFGAANDLNPGVGCLPTNLSGSGRDVVFQFTSPDTQLYEVTVTPVANYNASVYIVTSCPGLNGCTSADVGGGGDPEVLRRNMPVGVTFFIVVDGFQGDAGDFTISLVPTIPKAPDAPTNLVATVISATQVDLTWMDNSNNELGFRVLRSLNGFDFFEIGSVGSNVTMFSDTTVAPSTTFFYEVVAFNNFGTSAPSNIADATTPAPPPPPVAKISVVPDMIDFGSVGPSQAAEATVTISSVGGVDLVVSAISDPAAPFSIVNKPGLPLTINPGGNVDLTVRFAPLAAQMFASSFSIVSNDPMTPSVNVNLTGIGTAAPVPNLEVTPPVFDFPGGSSSTNAEFKNTGDADLLISSFILPRAPFALTGIPALPATLRPGESFIGTVSFSPASFGVFDGSFIVISNDPDGLLRTVRLRGTSTATNEALKLRAPTLATSIAGATTTLNVLAANGTNTDIRLQATAVTGGTFTDRGNGRGDLVFSPAADATGRVFVTYTARDSANRVKALQGIITILGNTDTHRVQVMWTLATASPNAPTDVLANDLAVTPLAAASAEAIAPADAPGLIGYLVHRSLTPGVPPALSNVVGIALTGQSSFVDTVPAPATSSQAFFYTVSAFYGSGTESAASNETSSAPRIVNLRYKGKALRFNAANSNVGTGAVLLVDGGSEMFNLERSGDLIIVNKNARSTPGGLRVRDIFKTGSSHTVQVRNANGVVSTVVTLAR